MSARSAWSRRFTCLRCALAAVCCTMVAVPAVIAPAAEEGATAAESGLSHNAAAIHQEVPFQASCRDIYAALTNSQRFDALTRLSDAVTLLTAPNAKATTISPELGGAFTLFGGYITGRNLVMIRDVRLVQAWRAGGWSTGEFSIVSFDLHPQGAGCRVIFDHRGFPDSQGASLAYGWRVHYWEPLAKLLSQAR